MSARYSVAYTAPAYLEPSASAFLSELNADQSAQIGEITGNPSVILIKESTEAGDQGYDSVLREQHKLTWKRDTLDTLINNFQPTDILLFPGKYPYGDVISLAITQNIRVHVDVQYSQNIEDITNRTEGVISTIFCSTSAPLFIVNASGSPRRLRELLPSQITSDLILKENRGGSRAYIGDDKEIAAPAYLGQTAHSVGVGDCFDCAWILASETEDRARSLARASYYASLYASTMIHADFVSEIKGAMTVDESIHSLSGTILPWETRADIQIYIAAPDFPDIETKSIDALEKALKYHGFSPQRPIKENGLCTPSTPDPEADRIYNADLELIKKCSILIAIPLTDDPGTFVELGIFCGTHRPTILYDATGRVGNLFARKSATRVCRDLNSVVGAVFELMGSKH
ncbi:hypothetical protein D7Y15_23235 [Corallococcus sp. AB030]|nr:hypothetical protein D7Y15_23235 [Corallococcus sp. AB030]